MKTPNFCAPAPLHGFVRIPFERDCDYDPHRFEEAPDFGEGELSPLALEEIRGGVFEWDGEKLIRKESLRALDEELIKRYNR